MEKANKNMDKLTDIATDTIMDKETTTAQQEHMIDASLEPMPIKESMAVLWAARRLCELKTPNVSFDDANDFSFACSSFESTASSALLSLSSSSSSSSLSGPSSLLSSAMPPSVADVASSSLPPVPPLPMPMTTPAMSPFATTTTAVHSANKVSREEIVFSLQDDDDEDNVNRLHQFVRRELIEVYVIPGEAQHSSTDGYEATEGDDEVELCGFVDTESFDGSSRDTRVHDSSAPIKHHVQQRAYPGRVGLRCIFCRQRAGSSSIRSSTVKMATVLPFSVKNLYRAVCRFQTTHFLNCPNVPQDMRSKYMALKASDRSRGNKKYWIVSAMRKGLMDHPDGIEGIVLDEEKFRRRSSSSTTGTGY